MGGGTPSVKTDPGNPLLAPTMIAGLGLGKGITDISIQMTPEMRAQQIDALQRTAAREAEINAYKSRALEAQMDPRLAEVRKGLSRQTAEDLEGGPSKELSNMWLKQGLSDIVSTGANLRSGFARSALADRTREDYYLARAAAQDRAARLLAANPMQLAGLDPGAIASYQTQMAAENANARDAYQTRNLGLMSNQAENAMGGLQQFAQMDAQRRSQNIQAQNAASAAGAGNKTALMGAGIGAAGAVAGAAIIF